MLFRSPLALAALFTVAVMALVELREMDGKQGNVERVLDFLSGGSDEEEEEEIRGLAPGPAVEPRESGNGKVSAR